MCFAASIRNKGHIATTDIRVEKVFLKKSDENFYRSPFYNDFKWWIGIEEQSILKKLKNTYFKEILIENGLHSAKHIDKSSTQYWVTYSTKGYAITRMRPEEPSVICECIIPKGAEYYCNKDGEYVSNRLILVKPIE